MRFDTRRVGLRGRGALVVLAAATSLAAAAPASAHEGEAFCTAELEQFGATYENSCVMPFQGFPIGITGVYDSEPDAVERTGTKPAEIHLELMAKLRTGAPQPLGVECLETGTGVARCTREYNPLGSPFSSPEPAPTEIVGIHCAGHSHASFSKNALPAGRFACWSTDESRATLQEDGWFDEPAATTGPTEGGATKRADRSAAAKRAAAREARRALRRLTGRSGRTLRALVKALARARSGSAGQRSAKKKHGGEAFCKADLEKFGNTYENSCVMPFQGFPIGIAGVYDSEPDAVARTGTKPAEIHLELMAKLRSGSPQPIGVECQDTTTGVARCTTAYNPFGSPLSSPEPAPSEIVGVYCGAHSHAIFSKDAPPAGRFACWSTDESRETLEQQGWFEDAGFNAGSGGGSEPPQPGQLSGLSGAGASGQITTVPFNTYAPSTVVVSRSLGLTYTNLDTARHDVVAREAKRPDGSAPWCEGFEDPEDPAAEACPLFWSKLIPGSGTQTPVLGLKDTAVGESYSFYCSIHPYMTGTIEVVE